jgi:methylmalonyl-CoA mutase C-terminal domain/subunit
VDLLGLSCLSGAHRYLYPAVTKLLKDKGADDIMVIGGGIIPEQDFQLMYDAGLKAIFVPGATLDSIVTWINTNVKPRA